MEEPALSECGLLEKKAVSRVHVSSVLTGLQVAEHGADTEHFLRSPTAPLPTQPCLHVLDVHSSLSSLLLGHRWCGLCEALELVGHH